MRILLKLSYFSIFLILVVAKKKKNYDSEIRRFPFSIEKYDQSKSNTSLNMIGDLRKYFSVEAALVKPNRNMVCSPISALLPLAKLALGATNKAKSELLSAIGLKKTRHIAKTFMKIINDLETLPGVTLDIASKLYVNKKAKVMNSYKSSASKIFKSTVESIKMSRPERAADKINEWVSKQTRGMIPTIISPDDLSTDTVMVLVNAIFFVGFWRSPFNTPKVDNFETPNGIRRMPMMSQEETFKYWKDDVLNAQIVELPYVGKESSFILVLPLNKYGLPMLLKQLKLAPSLLPRALERMTRAKVNLTMPKFKIETHLNLKPLYQKLGVRNIFEKKSYLTGIVKDDPVYVTHAVHKAVIEVHELGTKASAASAAGISLLSFSPQPPIRVHADHPFFYLIQAKNEQLFAGTFISPTYYE